MATKVLTMRIDNDVYNQIRAYARTENKSISAYAADKLKEAISEQQRIDLAVQKISAECLQIEGMLSIMQKFNTGVYSILLGRTTPQFSSVEQQTKAKENKVKATQMLEKMLSKSVTDVVNGDNVWGIVEVDDKEENDA